MLYRHRCKAHAAGSTLSAQLGHGLAPATAQGGTHHAGCGLGIEQVCGGVGEGGLAAGRLAFVVPLLAVVLVRDLESEELGATRLCIWVAARVTLLLLPN